MKERNLGTLWHMTTVNGNKKNKLMASQMTAYSYCWAGFQSKGTTCTMQIISLISRFFNTPAAFSELRLLPHAHKASRSVASIFSSRHGCTRKSRCGF